MRRGIREVSSAGWNVAEVHRSKEAGSTPASPTKQKKTMKQQSELRTEQAVTLLLQTLAHNINDTGIILDEFEATHDDAELCYSKPYNSLVAGHFAMKEAIERINNQLNK